MLLSNKHKYRVPEGFFLYPTQHHIRLCKGDFITVNHATVEMCARIGLSIPVLYTIKITENFLIDAIRL